MSQLADRWEAEVPVVMREAEKARVVAQQAAYAESAFMRTCHAAAIRNVLDGGDPADDWPPRPD